MDYPRYSMLTKRILILIFSVIALVVIGAIIYLFVYLPMMLKKAPSLPATIPASDTSKPKYASAAAENYIVRKTDPAQAISPEVEVQFLYILPRFKKGVLTKSVITNTYEGTVIRLRVNNNAKGNTTKLFLTIKGSEGYENDFSFSQKNVDEIASWNQTVDGEKKSISLKDLQAGDKVKIDSDVNLLGTYPDNRISLSFTIL